MACLTEDEILGYLDKSLGESELARIDAHMDGCATCRQLLGWAAREKHLSGGGRSDENDETLTPGTRVDHFEVVRRLGQGGMGEVFLATDVELHRPVALKLISPRLFDSDDAKKRLLVEARATARFSHPNIVAIYSVGEHRGWPYLALEYLEGETLRHRLARDPSIELHDALRIGLAIAEALEVAHEHHVLHRDLKPQNVFLCSNERVRVLDFGLAKLQRPKLELGESSESSPSPGATLIGTPTAMAPEQWRGERATGAADVWALGLIMYELLTGERPFHESSLISQALKVCDTTEVPAIASSDVPAGIARLVEHCLHKDPSERPSAAEVSQRLAAFINDQSLPLLSELRRAAERWLVGGRRDSELWDGLELARVQQWVERGSQPVPAAVARFVTASQRRARDQEQRKKRRLAILTGLGAFLALVASIFAGLAAVQERRARADQRRATRARASALVEGASADVRTGDYRAARAKLRSAMEVTDSAHARLLWRTLHREPMLFSEPLASSIFDIAVAPGRDRIAAAAQDRTVYLIDVETGELDSLRGHADQVMQVAYAEDGTLASSSWSGELRLWNPRAQSVRQVPGDWGRVRALAFVGGDLWFVDGTGTLYTWNPGSTDPPALWNDEGVTAMRFASGHLLTAHESGMARVWEPAERRVLRTLPMAGDREAGLALSPDGWKVALETNDPRVVITDIATNNELASWDTRPTGAQRLVFDHTGELLVVAEAAGNLWVWSVATSERWPLGKHDGTITALTRGPGLGQVVTASVDRTVRVWRPRLAVERRPSAGHEHSVAAVAFANDSNRLVSGGYDQTLRLWRAEDGEQLRIFTGHTGTIYDVAQSPNGNLWASASWDRTIRLWQLDHPTPIAILEGHEGGLYAVAFSPDGTRLASASTDHSVRIWNLASGEQERALLGHEGPVFEVAWTVGGVASASADHTIRLWSPDTGALLMELRGHEGPVWGLAMSADAALVASGSFDGTVRTWENGQSRLLGKHDGRVYSVALDPSAERLASVGADGAIMLWDLESGAGERLGQQPAEVNQVAFSPDGQWIATGSDDRTVRVWNVDAKRPRWRAPLLWPDPLQLITGTTVGESVPEQRLAAAARVADLHHDAICLITFSEQLERWHIGGAEALFSAVLQQATQVVALETGCLVLDNGKARLFFGRGESRDLREHVEWIGRAGDEPILVSGDQLFDGEHRVVTRATGITAATRVAGRWLLGFENGIVESIDRSLRLRATPSSPVRALAAGPLDTLVVGFDNGLFGLWSLESGALLATERLHGPVVHLFANDRVAAATTLGSMAAPIDVLGTPTCDLLAEVWDHAPLVWEDGALRATPVPADHRCVSQ